MHLRAFTLADMHACRYLQDITHSTNLAQTLLTCRLPCNAAQLLHCCTSRQVCDHSLTVHDQSDTTISSSLQRTTPWGFWLCWAHAQLCSCHWSDSKELCGAAGALEQESWSAVAVPTDSQHLINDWMEQAAQVKAAFASPAKRPAALSNGNKSPGQSHTTANLDAQT